MEGGEMTIMHINDYPKPKSCHGGSAGGVVPITWWQETVEKLLMCQKCKDVWVDIIAVTMPIHQIECETCLQKGYIIDSIPRRLR
jgi:hypothetical protein